jgi:hypothetical protein
MNAHPKCSNKLCQFRGGEVDDAHAATEKPGGVASPECSTSKLCQFTGAGERKGGRESATQ